MKDKIMAAMRSLFFLYIFHTYINKKMKGKKENMLDVNNIKKALTHAGVFHADDVFSAALLRIVNPNIIIEITKNIINIFDTFFFFLLKKCSHPKN